MIEPSFTHEIELMLIWRSLDDNNIGDEGAKSLASALQSQHCKVVSIWWDILWNSTRAREWTDIWDSLYKNHIGYEGAKSLASALRHPNCTVISITWVLVKSAPTSVSFLVINCNSVTDDDFTTFSLDVYPDLLRGAIDMRLQSLQSCRARCLVVLLAGATMERVGGKSTVFKMKIDIFRKLLTFLPL